MEEKTEYIANGQGLARDEYLCIQTMLVLIAQIAVLNFSDDDLKDFIAVGQRSMALGSMLNPTLYMMAGEKLRGILDIAKAMRAFRATAEKCWDMIEQGERTAQAYRSIGVNL